MKSGLWNIAFGTIGIIAGASGQYVFPGTQTSTPLMIVGGLVAAFGVSQLLRAARR